MSMNETYKYFAFISFQSKDAKEALWVQKAIENYRLPTAISRTRSLPKRMRPCFCYLNDINLSEELMQELKQRMEQSEYLIVLCSPRSAKSTFVNGGIDYFISLGRRDRIIPLIVDGIPYSGDPDTECYPEALRRNFPKNADPMLDHQILGVNINEEGAGSKRWKRQRAVLMVIARMLGLEFENLWNREVKRRRRRRIAITLIALAVAAALALTWYFARSIDIRLQAVETTEQNPHLPLCQDARLIVSLDNEQKTADSIDLHTPVVFSNIPRRFVGRKVRICFTGTGYLPVDTMLPLRQQMQIPIERDADLYGHVKVRLRGDKPNPEKLNVSIAGYNVKPTADGLIELDIPLAEQHTAYPVSVDTHLLPDSIYMPCGDNDIILY